MIALRKAHPAFGREQFYTDAEIHWFNPSRAAPDWADPHARQLACLIYDGSCDPLYLMFNAGAEAVAFGLPAPPGPRSWCVAADTSRDSSPSLSVAGPGPLYDAGHPYLVESRSSALLVALPAHRGDNHQLSPRPGRRISAPLRAQWRHRPAGRPTNGTAVARKAPIRGRAHLPTHVPRPVGRFVRTSR